MSPPPMFSSPEWAQAPQYDIPGTHVARQASVTGCILKPIKKVARLKAIIEKLVDSVKRSPTMRLS